MYGVYMISQAKESKIFMGDSFFSFSFTYMSLTSEIGKEYLFVWIKRVHRAYDLASASFTSFFRSVHVCDKFRVE